MDGLILRLCMEYLHTHPRLLPDELSMNEICDMYAVDMLIQHRRAETGVF